MNQATLFGERPELTELHCHVGGGVDPAIMWSIAHQQGIRLPSKDYWDFVELITVSHPDKVNNLAEYDQIFRWTELIQSSPLAIERSVYEIIGGAYRRCNITQLELAFQPDEAQPRRRTRPRPHHHRRYPGTGPRIARVSAGALGPDPDDGPHVYT